MADLVSVEVVYALPHKQRLVALKVPAGTTALEAARQADLEREFPELDLGSATLGLYGQAFGTKGLEPADRYALKPGDRVEIYRPLTADPKEARKRRAAKTQG